MPGAGDVSSNMGGVWYHTDAAGWVLDMRIGGFHFTPTTGSTWVAPGLIPPADYATLYAAAWTSAAAFTTVIIGGPWGAWYTGLGTPERDAVRRLVAVVQPLVRVQPPVP